MPTIEFFRDKVNCFQIKRGFIYETGVKWIITGYITDSFFYGIELDFN